MHDDLTFSLDNSVLDRSVLPLLLSKARSEILPCVKSIVKRSYIDGYDLLAVIRAIY